VGGRQPAADEEPGARFTYGDSSLERNEGRVEDLARLREPSHREVDPATLVRSRVVAEDPEEKRCLDRFRT
jgi:hypothetical protein